MKNKTIKVVAVMFCLLPLIIGGCRERHIETEADLIAKQTKQEISLLDYVKINGTPEERTSIEDVKKLYGEPTSTEATDRYIYHYDLKTLGIKITIGFDEQNRAISKEYEKAQTAGDPISRKVFHSLQVGMDLDEKKAIEMLGEPTRISELGATNQTSLTWIYNDKDEYGKNRSLLLILKDGKLAEVAPVDYLY
jgi:hypothetical protein